MRSAFLAAVAAIALIVPCDSSASVFARLRGRGGAQDVLRAAGASCLMRRDATVNGASGALSVWRVAPESAADAAAVRSSTGAFAAWLPESDGGATVFLFESPDSARGASSWPFAEIPAPAGFEPGFDAEWTARGASPCAICSGSADMPAEAARGALVAALAAAGCAELPPDMPGSGFSLWAHGDAVYAAWCGETSAQAATWLLLRRGRP